MSPNSNPCKVSPQMIKETNEDRSQERALRVLKARSSSTKRKRKKSKASKSKKKSKKLLSPFEGPTQLIDCGNYVAYRGHTIPKFWPNFDQALARVLSQTA